MNDPAAWNPSAPEEKPPTHKTPSLTLEQAATFADAAVKLVAVFAGVSAVMGWFVHGVWASRNGIQTNESLSFQYIAAGFIPTLWVFSCALAWWVARVNAAVYISIREGKLEPKAKRRKLQTFTVLYCLKVFGGLFVSMVVLVFLAYNLDPASLKNNLIPSTSGAFFVFASVLRPLIFPVSLFFVFYVVFTMWGETKSRIYDVIGMVIIVTLVLWDVSVYYQRNPPYGYYNVMPKQLGGAQPSPVTLMVEGAPSELYASGKNAQENRTRDLELVYIGEEFYVVKIPAKNQVYQLTKDQVKSIISTPQPTPSQKQP